MFSTNLLLIDQRATEISIQIYRRWNKGELKGACAEMCMSMDGSVRMYLPISLRCLWVTGLKHPTHTKTTRRTAFIVKSSGKLHWVDTKSKQKSNPISSAMGWTARAIVVTQRMRWKEKVVSLWQGFLTSTLNPISRSIVFMIVPYFFQTT